MFLINVGQYFTTLALVFFISTYRNNKRTTSNKNWGNKKGTNEKWVFITLAGSSFLLINEKITNLYDYQTPLVLFHHNEPPLLSCIGHTWRWNYEIPKIPRNKPPSLFFRDSIFYLSPFLLFPSIYSVDNNARALDHSLVDWFMFPSFHLRFINGNSLRYRLKQPDRPLFD